MSAKSSRSPVDAQGQIDTSANSTSANPALRPLSPAKTQNHACYSGVSLMSQAPKRWSFLFAGYCAVVDRAWPYYSPPLGL